MDVDAFWANKLFMNYKALNFVLWHFFENYNWQPTFCLSTTLCLQVTTFKKDHNFLYYIWLKSFTKSIFGFFLWQPPKIITNTIFRPSQLVLLKTSFQVLLEVIWLEKILRRLLKNLVVCQIQIFIIFLPQFFQSMY